MTTWAEYSDLILARLFADGHQPSQKEITEAYPFGERAMWPYKVWLSRVRIWKAGGLPHPRRLNNSKPLDGQEPML